MTGSRHAYTNLLLRVLCTNAIRNYYYSKIQTCSELACIGPTRQHYFQQNETSGE